MFRSGAVLRLSQYSMSDALNPESEILEVDGKVVREVKSSGIAERWVLTLGIVALALLVMLVPVLSYLSQHSAHPAAASAPHAPAATAPAAVTLGLDLRGLRP